MIKVSIIVPVYNTMPYLAKCLDSLCNQDYDKKDYEIIVVNDGSVDNSEKIILNYKEQYPDLIKYINKSNGGLSSARNAGLMQAKGKYILFVDSDDYVETELLSSLFSENEDYDLFIFGYNEINGNYSKANYVSKKILTDTQGALKLFFENKAVRGYSWNKLFKLDIIINNNIKFNEEIKYIEDMPFLMEYIEHCNTLYFSQLILYNYVQRPGSLINSVFNINKLTALTAYEKILNIIEQIDPRYISTIYYFIFELDYELSVRIRIGENFEHYLKEYNFLRKEMKKNLKKFIFKNVKIKYKIKAIIKYIFYEILIFRYGGNNEKN